MELNYMTRIFTPESFSIEVEKLYAENPEAMTYLEIASELMTENGIDQEDGGSLISPTLKEKIMVQSRERNLLKEKSSTKKLF